MIYTDLLWKYICIWLNITITSKQKSALDQEFYRFSMEIMLTTGAFLVYCIWGFLRCITDSFSTDE